MTDTLGLNFPDDLWYLVEHQVWARLDDAATATVGITSLGIRAAGEIYMCRAKAVGTEVEQGRSVGVVELAKSVVSVKTPVGGTVVANNAALEARPELVHLDPYGAGWIARIVLADFDRDRVRLHHGAGVAEAMVEYARLHRVDS